MQIGGYVPEFRVKLNVNLLSYEQITPLLSGLTIEETILDCNRQLETITGASYGSSYSVDAVPEITNFTGSIPLLSLSISDNNIASLDENNIIHYVNSGDFILFGNYPPSVYYANRKESVPLRSILTGGLVTIRDVFAPETINVSKHILVVYNTNSTNSINLKDYYTGTRPHFNSANVLGIACSTGETISDSQFTGTIRQPIINWITGNSPSKLIRYIIMMQDIPTRVSSSYSVSYQITKALSDLNIRTGTYYRNQNNHFSLGEYQGNTCLVSYINFGTYADSVQYINKISAGQSGIYLSGNGTNTGYYLEDYSSIYNTPWVNNVHLQPLLNEFPNVHYTYVNRTGIPITTGNNLAGFCSWGENGGRGGNYANDGSIKWGNLNNWYIMTTIESFNGLRTVGQGNFIDWFSSGAFGGTGYNNCPVGSVNHVDEPGLAGTANSGFFVLWERGWPFIECAWQSRNTPYFLACGDPLIIK